MDPSEQTSRMDIDQKMDQRITVRLTVDELKAVERAAIHEGDRKVSTLMRRALMIFLRDNGYNAALNEMANSPLPPAAYQMNESAGAYTAGYSAPQQPVH